MRVGFIGLGIMGSRMAVHLARAGHELTVWNRTRERAEAWAAEHGARVASTPAEVGAAGEVVITMVVDGPQVETVLLGPEGVAEKAAEGLLCVDMSTIAPGDSRRIGAALGERGIAFMDAPVSGSSPRAEEGTLTIMAGGRARDFERARPLFDAMGDLVVHAGALGDGEMLKVINNAVAAVNTAVIAEALLAARRAGVDLDVLERVMAASSGASAMLELKAGPMRRHDYQTLFKLEHMLKDVRLCLEAARAAGGDFPSAERVERILAEAEVRGLGEQDFAALVEIVEAQAGEKL